MTTAYPSERVAQILADARPRALVTRSARREQFTDWQGQAVEIEAIDGGDCDDADAAASCSAVVLTAKPWRVWFTRQAPPEPRKGWRWNIGRCSI
jgi:hypothetical protein